MAGSTIERTEVSPRNPDRKDSFPAVGLPKSSLKMVECFLWIEKAKQLLCVVLA
jgi:hypothetical protein